jgi:hypothetical protein
MEERKNIKVYGGTWQVGVVAGATTQTFFQIEAYRREMQIKSLIFQSKFRDLVSLLNYTEENVNTQTAHIDIVTVGASSFVITGGAAISMDGIFRIHRSNIYHFESFYFQNVIQFVLTMQNQHPANAFNHEITFLAEILEL